MGTNILIIQKPVGFTSALHFLFTVQNKSVTEEASSGQSLFHAPKQEVRTKRFPQCVIVGFTKTGTRALLEFLSLHPYIKVARNEIHFYDKDEHFKLGYAWYKNQMPFSYSNQITIEKTPAYILSERARDGIYKLSPDVKLIMLVRDPVIRLVSQFLLRFRLDDTADLRPVSDIYTNFTTGKFDPNLRPVDIGNYQKHIYMWLRRFTLRQMLIINSEDLTQKPLSVIQDIEKFLDIPRLFTEWNIYYNKTSGFFCPRGFEDTAKPRCLGKSKGLAHPKLSESQREMLYEYYKPFNEKLFHLIGYKIKWTEKDWGKKEDEHASGQSDSVMR